jgi:hypothetical protein
MNRMGDRIIDQRASCCWRPATGSEIYLSDGYATAEAHSP